MLINKAFEIIEKNKEDADFIGEIDEPTIIDAENKLNVKFPYSYKLFLKKFGSGKMFGEEIYGLGTEESGIPNMVWITKNLRREKLPNHLICIYYTGFNGFFYCLDCSKIQGNKDDNAPVVEFRSGNYLYEQSDNKIFENFGDFFYDLIRERPGDMPLITIDVSNVKKAKELHLLLKEKLEFPDFYGENWDAFWDAITGLVELPDKLEFIGWANLQKKLPRDATLMKKCLIDYNKQSYVKKCELIFNSHENKN